MIALILVLALIGFLAWVITTKIPMDPMVKVAIQVIIVVVMVLYILKTFGISDIPVPKL